MPVLITCKFKEDQIKNEGAQGQVTPNQLVGFGQNSIPSGILWLSWLPASLKMIQQKWRRYPLDNIFSL